MLCSLVLCALNVLRRPPQLLPCSTHVSCTVEKAVDTRASTGHQTVDVGVIDEIQMIADPWRGWAWTRALMGVAAREVHVCGDVSALPIVRRLASLMGDTLDVREYSRRTPLNVAKSSLNGDLSRVKPGDCVIAFSRKDIHRLRAAIQSITGRKACVVYGSLPPETRSAQARLFNDPASGYDIMVASDAVGMGLNLNIKRVIFSALEKFDVRWRWQWR